MPSRTVLVPPERLPGWLQRFAERHGETGVTTADRSHVLLTAADGATADLAVPFPPLPEAAELDALIGHATTDRTVAVVLVRRGGYGVGIFDGRELVASKVGSGYVQGRTKAGGWSQQRFARRRANQAQALWGDAADVAVRLLLPRRDDLDAIVTGGDQAGITSVLADPRLADLDALVSPVVLDVPDPRLVVLAATPDQFRAVRITLNDLA